MEEKKEAELGNSILAVAGGAVASFLVILVLYPVELLVFNKFFELQFGMQYTGYSTNDIILLISFIIWFSIAAFAGGMVCALICRVYEYRHTWILTGLTFLLFVINTWDSRREDAIPFFLLFAGVCLCFFFGTRTGIQIKIKRRNKKAAKKFTEELKG